MFPFDLRSDYNITYISYPVLKHSQKKHTVQCTFCSDFLFTHGSKLNCQYFRLLKDIFGVILMSSC